MSKKLPPEWETRFKSAYLKEKIADSGMWLFIPGVKPSINSAKGKRRLEQNEPLFSFIDTYFPEGPFAFEPNMGDGRFMFIPDEFHHQGMAVCASLMIPGALEVGHFWYPRDFSEYRISKDPDQVYVPTFTTTLQDQLAGMVQRIYMEQVPNGQFAPHPRCDFPFEINLSVRLEGYFMDDVDGSAKIVKNALRNQSAQTRRNGEALTMFMRRMDPHSRTGRK